VIKKQKRPRDVNQRAASTVELATGEITKDNVEIQQVIEVTPEQQHAAAVSLGRKGGQRRAKNLTPERRKEIAKKAANKRWKRD
jgi:hypothetical protein